MRPCGLRSAEAALPRPRAKSAEQEEAAEAARHAAAVQQLLGLVEGLEEELFNAEARRHDAEVEVCSFCLTKSADDENRSLAEEMSKLGNTPSKWESCRVVLLGYRSRGFSPQAWSGASTGVQLLRA